MAFDGIVTKAIITELSDIIGSKIDKIHQPDKNTVLMSLYNQGKHLALNICIDAHNCRINLTTHSRVNPLVAPNFCMLLRKHLMGGRIANINMQGLERIVNIDIETINEFNEIETKTLIVELMGRHSNIILTNKNNIIIDAMRHVYATNNSYRDIFPSCQYHVPHTDKFDFIATKNFDDFYNKLNLDIELPKALVEAFTGFSLSFANSIIEKCNLKSNSKNEIQVLYEYILQILNNSSSLSFERIYKNDKLSDYVLIIDNSNEKYNLNFFIDDFYFERETSETFINSRNSILKLILNALKKYQNRLISINSKLEECNEMDKYKLYGELITANLYRINNSHISHIQLENYYDNNSIIDIPLDIKYSPNINAKRYFKKYNKLKNAFQIVSEQKIETERELDYIESIVYEIDSASTLEEIQTIFEEISESQIFKDKVKNKTKKSKSKKNKATAKFAPIEYEIDNYKIYVGRNNKENDWLTFTFAKKDDIWFHTKDIHGSHVILKTGNSPVSNDILIKCAQIAAKHSKATISSNVPVDYCFVKFVKKPNNAKPGMVIFTNNKTLNVNPNLSED